MSEMIPSLSSYVWKNDKSETVSIFGIPFNNVSKKEMTGHINEFVHSNTIDNLFIVTANPEIAYYAHTHESYYNKIKTADFIVPDGIGIIKAAKYLKQPMKERVPGIELMENMLSIADEYELRVFLLGASKETVKECKRKLRHTYPNIDFKSKHGYKDVHDYKTLQKIKKFNPDFVFVAMGCPKQEDFIFYNQHHFEHTVFMGVGGSFDVFSGNVKRAPKLFINLNLEWLYRILTDFKRMKRALIIPMFLMKVFQQKHTPELNPHAHFKEKE